MSHSAPKGAVLLVVIVLSFIVVGCTAERAPGITRGVVDLRTWDFAAVPLVLLEGYWEFWPGQHLFPHQLATYAVPDYMMVPANWSSGLKSGKPFPGQGIGTYHVKIVLPAGTNTHDNSAWALNVEYAGTSWNLYINGHLVRSCGRAGITAGSSVPHYATETIPIIPEESADGSALVDVVFQMSNFVHRDGGLWAPVSFGPLGAVYRKTLMSQYVELFFWGALLIMGIYHLILFVRQMASREYLWFAILCLLLGVHTLVWGQFTLGTVWPDISWELMVKIEYTLKMLSLAALFAYMRRLYPKEFPLPVVLVVIISCLANAIFNVVAPVLYVTMGSPYSMYILGMGMIAMVVGVLIAVFRHRDYAIMFFAGMLLLGVSLLNDMLSAMAIIHTDTMIPYGFLVFVMLQAVLLAGRFWKSYQKSLVLTERLALSVRELERTNTSYGRFVPVQFLQHLGRDRITDVALGDQVARTMTVLFTDIRNFTSLSEAMNPQENFNFLNSFLNRVGPAIRENHGFIDKYIGDGIMALFDGGADRAMQSAIDMQLAMVEYNRHRASSGYPPVLIGIGIHQGPLMLGIIGEEGRMESTVIADAVNMASRIESLTKYYQARILVSRSTFEMSHVPERYQHRPVDLVRVKGKKSAVELFEMLDPRFEPGAEEKIRLAPLLRQAMLLYRAGELEAAEMMFQNLKRDDRNDELYRIYLDRISEHRVMGVEADWDGSAILDHK